MISKSGNSSHCPVCTGTAVRFQVQAGAKNGQWAERLHENSKMLSTLDQFASCEPLWSLRAETKYTLLLRGGQQHQLRVLLLLLSLSLPSFFSQTERQVAGLRLGAVLRAVRVVSNRRQVSAEHTGPTAQPSQLEPGQLFSPTSVQPCHHREAGFPHPGLVLAIKHLKRVRSELILLGNNDPLGEERKTKENQGEHEWGAG